MAKVCVTRRIPPVGLEILGSRFEMEMNLEDRPLERRELLPAIADADGVLCLLTDRIDAEAMDAAPRARGFANFAVGFDNMNVDEEAFVAALREGVIAAAGLDVHEREPVAATGLASLPNVVMTPHTTSATVTSRNGMAIKAANNLVAMVNGERAPDCLNPQIYR